MDDVLGAIAAAGYEGVETTPVMLGDLLDQPNRFAGMLSEHGLTLAALALSTPYGWTDPAREDEELRLTDRGISFLMGVARADAGLVAPRPRLALGGGRAPGLRPRLGRGPHPNPLAEGEGAWAQMLRAYRLAAARAIAAGCAVNVHPTSTPDSIVRTGADYDRLVAGLPADVRLGPDASHVVRGDDAPVALFRRHLARIGHVHLGDARRGPDGEFAMLGRGDADIPAVVALLAEHGYDGWLVAEEEAPESAADPAGAVAADRAYLRSLGV
jgi:inosose dehydratase